MNLFFDAIYLVSNSPNQDLLTSLRKLTDRKIEIVKYGAEEYKTGAHLKCLIKSHKKKYTSYLIAENSMCMTQSVVKDIKKFFMSEMPWDVFILNGNFNQRTATKYKCMYQILETSELSCYAVINSFYTTLIKSIPQESYDIGFLWNHIQHESSWYMMEENIVITEYPLPPKKVKKKTRLMNIRNRHNPSKYINVEVELNIDMSSESELSEVEEPEPEPEQVPHTTDMFKPVIEEPEAEPEPEPKFFLAIRSTNACMETTKKQRLFKYRKFKEQFPNMVYYNFVGNPQQSDTYVIDEDKHLVSLQCKDDILNYPHKAFKIFQFISDRYPDSTGVYYTHEKIDLNLQVLYEKLHKHKHQKYYGINLRSLNGKCIELYIQNLRNIKDIYDEDYPFIRAHPLLLECSYLSSDGIYLNNESIELLLGCGDTMLAPMPSPTKYERFKVRSSKSTKFRDYYHYKALPVLDDYSIAYILLKGGIPPVVIK
jgi:hypothetical protein